jgi:hypothetical protein
MREARSLANVRDRGRQIFISTDHRGAEKRFSPYARRFPHDEENPYLRMRPPVAFTDSQPIVQATRLTKASRL